MQTVNNFTVFESIYGRFVVNRNCDFQADALAKTGKPHIQSELNNILAIAGTVPEGGLCLDAGANIGLVAIPLAHLMRERKGRVVAFEVQRMIYYALCGAAALNDLDNLVAIQAGLGDEMGEIAMPPVDYGAPQDFGQLSLVNAAKAQAGAETVDVVTIDSLDLERLDFLKIDVEGMELQVLRGGHETIAKFRPWCWIEYWLIGADKIKDAFDAYPDYDFYVMDNLNILCAPRERVRDSGLTIQADPL